MPGTPSNHLDQDQPTQRSTGGKTREVYARRNVEAKGRHRKTLRPKRARRAAGGVSPLDRRGVLPHTFPSNATATLEIPP